MNSYTSYIDITHARYILYLPVLTSVLILLSSGQRQRVSQDAQHAHSSNEDIQVFPLIPKGAHGVEEEGGGQRETVVVWWWCSLWLWFWRLMLLLIYCWFVSLIPVQCFCSATFLIWICGFNLSRWHWGVLVAFSFYRNRSGVFGEGGWGRGLNRNSEHSRHAWIHFPHAVPFCCDASSLLKWNASWPIFFSSCIKYQYCLILLIANFFYISVSMFCTSAFMGLQCLNEQLTSTGVCGWLANMLDGKWRGQGSTPGRCRVRDHSAVLLSTPLGSSEHTALHFWAHLWGRLQNYLLAFASFAHPTLAFDLMIHPDLAYWKNMICIGSVSVSLSVHATTNSSSYMSF